MVKNIDRSLVNRILFALLLVGLTLLFMGCGTSGVFGPVRHEYGLMPVGGSELPNVDVTLRQRNLVLGNHSRHEDRGTSQNVDIYLGPYGQRIVRYSERTWDDKSIDSTTETVPFIPTTVNAHFVYPGSSGRASGGVTQGRGQVVR